MDDIGEKDESGEQVEAWRLVRPWRPHRPAQYDQKLADEILKRIADGETLKSICLDPNMPSSHSVHDWTRGQNGAPPSWITNYARARLHQADGFAADIIELADAADDKAREAAERALAQLPASATFGDKRRAFFYAKKRSIEATKLAMDARKWTAARLNPQRWGDRVTVDISGGAQPVKIDFTKLTTEQLERIAVLESQIAREAVALGTGSDIIDVTPVGEHTAVVDANNE